MRLKHTLWYWSVRSLLEYLAQFQVGVAIHRFSTLLEQGAKNTVEPVKPKTDDTYIIWWDQRSDITENQRSKIKENAMWSWTEKYVSSLPLRRVWLMKNDVAHSCVITNHKINFEDHFFCRIFDAATFTNSRTLPATPPAPRAHRRAWCSRTRTSSRTWPRLSTRWRRSWRMEHWIRMTWVDLWSLSMEKWVAWFRNVSLIP